MNMKKSIAGVMAGAMAVSAMAATVSADQDAISLTFDLKTYVDDVNGTKAKLTVVANYEGTYISSASLRDNVIEFGADNGYVRGGDIYNSAGIKIGYVEKKGWDSTAANDAQMTDFEFTARPYKDLVNEDQKKYQTFKATGDANTVDGSYWDKDQLKNGKSTYKMTIGANANMAGKFDISNYDMWRLGYCNGFVDKDGKSGKQAAEAVNMPVASEDRTMFAFQDAIAKMTYEVPNTVYLNKADGWGWNGGLTVDDINNVATEFHKYGTYGDVTMSADTFAGGWFNGKYEDGSAKPKKTVLIYKDGSNVGTGYTADFYGKYKGNGDWEESGIAFSKYALVVSPTTTGVGAFEAGAVSKAVIPFKTTLKPVTDKVRTYKDANGKEHEIKVPDNDVVAALQNRKDGGHWYTKPVAVINDAIANHDDVVFTFVTYGGHVGTYKSHAMHQWVNVDQGYDYATSDFDWFNPTFGQHLYTNVNNGYSLYDSNEYDVYGSYSSAWGINLFTGAVVVNNGLTMQLNDTDKFDWGSNTLTFNWFDIIDEGKITDAKTFMTSMLLYTPVDWYWDSLTVVVADEDESIDAGEGLEGDGDVIDDEEIDEVVDEPVDEPEEVEEVAAPVEAAPSPATGNAPVALAVVPVALAAAAVVAKKRG